MIQPVPPDWRPDDVRDEGETLLALHSATGPEGTFPLTLRVRKGVDDEMTRCVDLALCVSIWQGAELVRLGQSSKLKLPLGHP